MAEKDNAEEIEVTIDVAYPNRAETEQLTRDPAASARLLLDAVHKKALETARKALEVDRLHLSNKERKETVNNRTDYHHRRSPPSPSQQRRRPETAQPSSRQTEEWKKQKSTAKQQRPFSAAVSRASGEGPPHNRRRERNDALKARTEQEKEADEAEERFEPLRQGLAFDEVASEEGSRIDQMDTVSFGGDSLEDVEEGPQSGAVREGGGGENEKETESVSTPFEREKVQNLPRPTVPRAPAHSSTPSALRRSSSSSSSTAALQEKFQHLQERFTGRGPQRQQRAASARANREEAAEGSSSGQYGRKRPPPRPSSARGRPTALEQPLSSLSRSGASSRASPSRTRGSSPRDIVETSSALRDLLR